MWVQSAPIAHVDFIDRHEGAVISEFSVDQDALEMDANYLEKQMAAVMGAASVEDARVRRVASHPRVLMTKLAWGGSVQIPLAVVAWSQPRSATCSDCRTTFCSTFGVGVFSSTFGATCFVSEAAVGSIPGATCCVCCTTF